MLSLNLVFSIWKIWYLCSESRKLEKSLSVILKFSLEGGATDFSLVAAMQEHQGL